MDAMPNVKQHIHATVEKVELMACNFKPLKCACFSKCIFALLTVILLVSVGIGAAKHAHQFPRRHHMRSHRVHHHGKGRHHHHAPRTPEGPIEAHATAGPATEPQSAASASASPAAAGDASEETKGRNLQEEPKLVHHPK